ncbi:O-antigen ligase [Pedobacter sp. SYSU D00535]|uniref:O-antigen ligase family protein n=1 Tax=Pedobacter sp. SYSU D00535 TaxID=2810308 RepID=UPI001A959D65|nr:O-antigen ligase family protein [Pedobacter sp. SYSU D00535]
MTGVFRVPAPFLAVPLVFFFYDEPLNGFKYTKELVVLFLAALFYYLIGQANIITFISVMITFTCCALFFNYFIGNNLKRLQLSVFLFFFFLVCSALVMLLNHHYRIEDIRSMLVGETVQQSPSGISTYIFSFGYQLSALVAFLAVFITAARKGVILSILVIAICGVLIFYGLQRSVLMTFSICLLLFLTIWYRFRAVLLFSFIFIIAVSFKSSVEGLSSGAQQNILTKNERSKNEGENREALVTENLKVIADHPFGLILSGMDWKDVVKHNVFYKSGTGVITSHNAYLMFLTYLGIIPGLLFLYLIYARVVRITWSVLKHAKDKKNTLLIALCMSFLGISLNACFHNEWLLAASGPTLFLYFCILQLSRIKANQASIDN